MEYMRESNITVPSVFTLESLLESYNNKTVLFAKALVYDRGKGLRFNLGGYEAFMPNEEVYLSFDNFTKEAAIATRVNKFICFRVLILIVYIYFFLLHVAILLFLNVLVSIFL